MNDLARDYEALTGKLALLQTWELPQYMNLRSNEALYICELRERINRLRELVSHTS